MGKLASTEPDRLIEMLSRVKFEEAQLDKNIEKINEILGETQEVVEVTGETREILKLWEKVEQGEIAPEEVEEKLESKVEAAGEEEKLEEKA